MKLSYTIKDTSNYVAVKKANDILNKMYNRGVIVGSTKVEFVKIFYNDPWTNVVIIIDGRLYCGSAKRHPNDKKIKLGTAIQIAIYRALVQYTQLFYDIKLCNQSDPKVNKDSAVLL